MRVLASKVPPLLLAAVVGACMWGVSQVTGRMPVPEIVRMGGAALLLALGVFFSVAGVISFRQANTTVDPRKPEAASSLVSSGIYRFSRNPMYVGFALALSAWAVFLASAWSLSGVVGFVLYLNHFQIIPEEQALRELFGEEFRAYESRVRRWL
ncbi:isoprenylcysteine carboxylmethyltransferase family protein [Marinobacter sediminum]|uniref:methyltransferase family protein n=1 Tax=Marinobacter sediminum TaxID=256323 RepID=UPI00202F2D97|nr:isoprenylcysteine carboxylmethyltransferase family protein [Marinobacter sediminum]MCM0611264.1 isoprenylcysteine carboxylmethyltransferase family protein [Marinobacter sediminum]